MSVSGDSLASYESEIRRAAGRVGIVTPAPPGSRRGNRVTAERWAALLGECGYAVRVVEEYADEPFRALVVLHAGRGADSVRRFGERFPGRPLVVAVTGTDVYGDQFDPSVVQHSLAVADRVVVLQPRTADDLPESVRPKVRVIYQSAIPPVRRD